jgi:hypothetical protein
LVWTLNMGPNQLHSIYWSHSLSDLKSLVSVRSQYEIAKTNQQYESLVLVASAIFGGGGNANSVDSFDQLSAFVSEIG